MPFSLRFVLEDENSGVFLGGVFDRAVERAGSDETGNAEIQAVGARSANDPSGLTRIDISQGSHALEFAGGSQHGFRVFGRITDGGHTGKTHGLWLNLVQLAVTQRYGARRQICGPQRYAQSFAPFRRHISRAGVSE